MAEIPEEALHAIGANATAIIDGAVVAVVVVYTVHRIGVAVVRAKHPELTSSALLKERDSNIDYPTRRGSR